MRWIFYTLIALNLGYFIWQVAVTSRVHTVIPPQLNARANSGDSIKLLAEAREEIKPVAQTKSEESANSIAAAPNPIREGNAVGAGSLCDQFGPFVDASSRSLFVNFLLGLNFRPQVFKESLVLEPFYWVYLPPLESTMRALEIMSELKAKSVEAFLISEGELKDGLSLGVYQDDAAVGALRGAVKEMGFNIEVLKKSRSYEAEWVQLQRKDRENGGAESLIKVREQYPQVKYRQKVCKSVASVS